MRASARVHVYVCSCVGDRVLPPITSLSLSPPPSSPFNICVSVASFAACIRSRLQLVWLRKPQVRGGGNGRAVERDGGYEAIDSSMHLWYACVRAKSPILMIRHHQLRRPWRWRGPGRRAHTLLAPKPCGQTDRQFTGGLWWRWWCALWLCVCDGVRSSLIGCLPRSNYACFGHILGCLAIVPHRQSVFTQGQMQGNCSWQCECCAQLPPPASSLSSSA